MQIVDRIGYRLTVIMEGVPPIWDPPQTDPVLKPDTAGRYVDQNADRTPGSPLQALIHAVQTCQPKFDFRDVSIVTDRKPVRCLLGFVLGESLAFRFGITVIGKTALFTRMEKRTRDQPSWRFIRYRDSFEEHYTRISSSAARTTSHYRVVRYEFAEQNILLRYAVDAYRGSFAEVLMQADGIEDIDPGPLVKPHRHLNIKGKPHSKRVPTRTPIKIINSGRRIPHAATLELTTRAQHNPSADSIEQKIPDCWISQTLNYHLCFHRPQMAGSSKPTIFNRIEYIPMGVLLIDWEKANAEKLRALAHLLGDVIRAAKELGGSCIVSCDGSKGGTVKVSRANREEIPALPEDMQSLFAPIEKKTVEMPIKPGEVANRVTTAGQDGLRNPEYDTGNAPEPTDPAHARKALDSVLHIPRQAVAPVSFNEEEPGA